MEHKISMDTEWERRKKSKELGLLPSQKLEQFMTSSEERQSMTLHEEQQSMTLHEECQ